MRRAVFVCFLAAGCSGSAAAGVFLDGGADTGPMQLDASADGAPDTMAEAAIEDAPADVARDTGGSLEGGARDASEGGAVDACIPTGACSSQQNCGTKPNGCGGVWTCGGNCSGGETCGGGGAPNVCGSGYCEGGSIPACPPSPACGTVSDPCGDTMSCGTCDPKNICGISHPNVCGGFWEKCSMTFGGFDDAGESQDTKVCLVQSSGSTSYWCGPSQIPGWCHTFQPGDPPGCQYACPYP